MGQRKIGIDRDRTLKKRQGTYRAGKGRFHSGAVGLQRFERRRRRFERRRVSLDGGERFANARPEPRRHLAERAQNIFFPRRLVPARRRACPRSRSWLRAARGRTDCRAPQSIPRRTAAPPVRTQMSRATSAVSRASAGWLINWQRSADAFVGDEAQERRLLSCTASPCRSVSSNTGSPVVLVKSARTIVSLSVSAGGPAAVDRTRDCGCHEDSGADRQPTRATRREHGPLSRGGVRLEARRLTIALQPLQVRANLATRAGSEGRDPSPGTCRRSAPIPAAARDSVVRSGAGARFRMPSKISPGLSP